MMHKGFIKFSIFALIVGLVSGCGSGSRPENPPIIRFGEDPCDECKMIINEARFAAGFIMADGSERRFDDLGCFLLYQKENHKNIARAWVMDYQNQNWLKADSAFFLKSKAILTPMGFGLVAFADREQAEELKNKLGGNLLFYNSLITEDFSNEK